MSDNSEKKCIVIDLRGKPKTGIGRYALRLMTGEAFVFEPFRRLGGGENDTTTRGKALLRMLDELLLLPFSLKKQKAALFHCTKNFGLPLFVFGTKRVLTVMDIIPLKFPDYAPNVFFRLFYFWNLFLSCAAADRIICISRFSADELIARFPFVRKKVEVIYLGVDAAHFGKRPAGGGELPQLAPGRKFLLTIGGTEPRKNTRLVMDLFLAGLLPEYDLLVLGGEWKGCRFTPEQRNASRIHLVGKVSEEQLISLYHEAEVFIFPSVYEGFGLPPLEAMACGTPVAAARTSCLPEILGDAAEWFDPADPRDLLRALEKITGDPVRRAELIRRGVSRAAEYPWEKTLTQTQDLYRRVLER